jgi:hypothetical protein
LLPQIELHVLPDQCLSELIVLFRGDELESGALVDAARGVGTHFAARALPNPHASLKMVATVDRHPAHTLQRRSWFQRVIKVQTDASVTNRHEQRQMFPPKAEGCSSDTRRTRRSIRRQCCS